MEFFEPYLLKLPAVCQPYFRAALPVWLDGGWAMIPLFAIGVVMYVIGLGTFFQLLLAGARGSAEKAWRRWQINPTRLSGPIQKLIGAAMKSETIEELQLYFSLLGSTETGPFRRNLQVVKVCVSTAPLLGLLGTVTGMLTTFSGLAKGGGGDKTMAVIASGISEALITTETGLVVALTGLMIQFFLNRQYQRYEIVLAHVETICMRALQEPKKEVSEV